MLLLRMPTLMTLLLTAITLCTSVLLVGLNNGYAITISRVLTPIVYIKDIALMLVEYDAVVYASLLIYLNVNLRNACKDILKDIFNQYGCSKVLNINQI